MHRQKPQLKWKCHTHMFYKDTVHSNGFIYWNQVMLLWLCFSGNLHLACYAVLFCISLKLYLGLRMFRYFSGQEDKNTGNENDFYWWNIHLFVNRGHSPPVFLVSSNKGGSIMYGWCYMQIMSCIVKRHCWKEAGWRTTHVHARRLEQNGNFSYIVMLDFFFFFLLRNHNGGGTGLISHWPTASSCFYNSNRWQQWYFTLCHCSSLK